MEEEIIATEGGSIGYPRIPDDKLQDFLGRLTLNGDVSRLTRWTINTANRMRVKEKKPYLEII